MDESSSSSEKKETAGLEKLSADAFNILAKPDESGESPSVELTTEKLLCDKFDSLVQVIPQAINPMFTKLDALSAMLPGSEPKNKEESRRKITDAAVNIRFPNRIWSTH